MEFLTEAEFIDRNGEIPITYQWQAAGAYLKKLREGELSERKQRQLPAIIHLLERSDRGDNAAERVALNHGFGFRVTRQQKIQCFLEELKRRVLPYYFEFRLDESGYRDLPQRQHDASMREWVTALSTVSDVPSCLFYLLLSNPGLLERRCSAKKNNEMIKQQQLLRATKKRRVDLPAPG